jgi:hypothetical protein
LRNLQLRCLSRGIAQHDAHFLDLQAERRELRGCAVTVARVSLGEGPIQAGEGDGKLGQLEIRLSGRGLRRHSRGRVLGLEPGYQQVQLILQILQGVGTKLQQNACELIERGDLRCVQAERDERGI